MTSGKRTRAGMTPGKRTVAKRDTSDQTDFFSYIFIFLFTLATKYNKIQIYKLLVGSVTSLWTLASVLLVRRSVMIS